MFVLRIIRNTQIPSLSEIQTFRNAKAGGTYGNHSVVKGYDGVLKLILYVVGLSLFLAPYVVAHCNMGVMLGRNK